MKFTLLVTLAFGITDESNGSEIRAVTNSVGSGNQQNRQMQIAARNEEFRNENQGNYEPRTRNLVTPFAYWCEFQDLIQRGVSWELIMFGMDGQLRIQYVNRDFAHFMNYFANQLRQHIPLELAVFNSFQRIPFNMFPGQDIPLLVERIRSGIDWTMALNQVQHSVKFTAMMDNIQNEIRRGANWPAAISSTFILYPPFNDLTLDSMEDASMSSEDSPMITEYPIQENNGESEDSSLASEHSATNEDKENQTP